MELQHKHNKEDVIKAFFKYDCNTGEISWREDVSHQWWERKWRYERFMDEKSGQPVRFTLHRDGHLFTGAAGFTCLYAHHIAWYLYYGTLPKYGIDHEDGDPSNNRITNLRDTGQPLNGKNQKMKGHNTSGHTGVSWDNKGRKWRVYVNVEGNCIHLGMYKELKAAVKARQDWMDKHGDKYGFSERHGT